MKIIPKRYQKVRPKIKNHQKSKTRKMPPDALKMKSVTWRPNLKREVAFVVHIAPVFFFWCWPWLLKGLWKAVVWWKMCFLFPKDDGFIAGLLTFPQARRCLQLSFVSMRYGFYGILHGSRWLLPDSPNAIPLQTSLKNTQAKALGLDSP